MRRRTEQENAQQVSQKHEKYIFEKIKNRVDATNVFWQIVPRSLQFM